MTIQTTVQQRPERVSTPVVAAYGVWVTIHSIAAVTATLGIERTLMDVVKGARKGATFQYFVIFMMGGSFGGQLLGSALGDVVGMEWLHVLGLHHRRRCRVLRDRARPAAQGGMNDMRYDISGSDELFLRLPGRGDRLRNLLQKNIKIGQD